MSRSGQSTIVLPYTEGKYGSMPSPVAPNIRPFEGSARLTSNCIDRKRGEEATLSFHSSSTPVSSSSRVQNGTPAHGQRAERLQRPFDISIKGTYMMIYANYMFVVYVKCSVIALYTQREVNIAWWNG